MKVAHLTTVDLSLRYLLLAQLEAALEVGEAIGISAPGEFVADLEEYGIRHIPLPSSTRGMDPVSDLKAALELWKILRRENIDILHTHNPKPGVYGRILGRLAGVPIVINTVHGLYATENSSWAKKGLVYTLEWVASRFSDTELIQNPEDLHLLTRLRIVSRHKLKLLGNGVDLKKFRRSNSTREEVRSELGVRDDQILTGLVARLVDEKGVPEVVEAAARLDDRYVFVIAGPRDAQKADGVSDLVIREGESAGVRFLGMRRDVDRLYSGMDIFVLPSHREGFPRAAMEAAASGLPVIATDIRGCRQVVRNGVNGILFPVGDVDALVSAVERIGSNSDLRESMGQASVQRAAAYFDEDKVVEIVMGAYREVAGRKGLGWPISD